MLLTMDLLILLQNTKSLVLKNIIPLWILVIVLAVVTATLTIAGNAALLLIVRVAYIAALIYLVAKSLSYVITSYILYDEPSLSSKEIVEKSASLMNGNRKRFIFLIIVENGYNFIYNYKVKKISN